MGGDKEWKWLVSNPGERLISSSQQINNFLPNTTKGITFRCKQTHKQTDKQQSIGYITKIIGKFKKTFTYMHI